MNRFATALQLQIGARDLYRNRTKARVKTCARDGCDVTFQPHGKQIYCTRECSARVQKQKWQDAHPRPATKEPTQ